jgi:hypothetical protein
MARRFQLSHKIKEEMVKEIYKQRIGPRDTKTDFENIKQRLRLKMSESEIEELCYCLAYTVVNSGSLVRLTERRTEIEFRTNTRNKLTVRGR